MIFALGVAGEGYIGEVGGRAGVLCKPGRDGIAGVALEDEVDEEAVLIEERGPAGRVGVYGCPPAAFPSAAASGSLACAVLAVQAGVNIIRAHDVAETVQAVRLAEALLARKKN